MYASAGVCFGEATNHKKPQQTTRNHNMTNDTKHEIIHERHTRVVKSSIEIQPHSKTGAVHVNQYPSSDFEVPVIILGL